MAIGFHQMSYVSRSTGRSAVQAFAYISATTQFDSRRGLTTNYQNKADCVSTYAIVAPDHAPIWAKSVDVWDRLEQFVDSTIEDRYLLPETISHFKNTARVAQTHVFALPIELNEEDWNSILKELISEQFTARDLVVGYAIHNDDGNPHAHLMTSLHRINEHDFVSIKERELYQNSFRKDVFAGFADLCNARLIERGFNSQIDPRSYAERGLDLEPFVHEGWHARALAEKGEVSRLVLENEQIRLENAVKISKILLLS